MRITITSIELRSVWQFFSLSNHGRKIQAQAKRTPGFRRMKNTGWGRLHYTLSIWESVSSMKAFARTGAHLEAMKRSAKLAVEIRTHTFEADQIPNWKEVKRLLITEGKSLTFPSPSKA
jgi:heme-degrading monooxygenase HmoA